MYCKSILFQHNGWGLTIHHILIFDIHTYTIPYNPSSSCIHHTCDVNWEEYNMQTRAMRPNGRGRARAGGLLSLVAAEAVGDDVAVHDDQCTWRTCSTCISVLLVQWQKDKSKFRPTSAWICQKRESKRWTSHLCRLAFHRWSTFIQPCFISACLSLSHFDPFCIPLRPNTSRNTATTVAVMLPKGAATSAGPIAPQAKETRMAEHDLRAPTTLSTVKISGCCLFKEREVTKVPPLHADSLQFQIQILIGHYMSGAFLHAIAVPPKLPEKPMCRLFFMCLYVFLCFSLSLCQCYIC